MWGNLGKPQLGMEHGCCWQGLCAEWAVAGSSSFGEAAWCLESFPHSLKPPACSQHVSPAVRWKPEPQTLAKSIVCGRLTQCQHPAGAHSAHPSISPRYRGWLVRRICCVLAVGSWKVLTNTPGDLLERVCSNKRCVGTAPCSPSVPPPWGRRTGAAPCRTALGDVALSGTCHLHPCHC